MTYLICENCGWEGDHDELVSLTEDLGDRHFAFCPVCSGKNFDEIDDEEEEF